MPSQEYRCLTLLYLCCVPCLVLQRSCEDVVGDVEDEEADDQQGTSKGPHDFPVPVWLAPSHGVKIFLKPV